MDARRSQTALRATAALQAVFGAVLVLSTWDWLYQSIDLAKPSPAVLAQIGGLAVMALAYLLWAAASNPALRRPVATAAAAANLGGAIIIVLWLVTRDTLDLEVPDSGIVVLAIVAALMAIVAVLQALAARAPVAERD